MAQVRNVKAASLELVGKVHKHTVKVDAASKQFIKEHASNIHYDSHNGNYRFQDSLTGTTLARAMYKSVKGKNPPSRKKIMFKNGNNMDFRSVNLI